MADPVIRRMTRDDLPGLFPVLAETDLFPASLLPGLAGDDFDNPSRSLWLMAEGVGGASGFAHAQPEPLTDGTWNLRALAVRPRMQGCGLGAALVAATEAALAAQGGRLLVVDTAGTDGYAVARRLYARCGYAEAARIPDFWADGMDRLTFAKRL